MDYLKMLSCIAIGAIAGYSLGKEYGYSEGYNEAISAVNLEALTTQTKHDANATIVYQKQIESKIVYVDRVKKVKEYVYQTIDYNDTVCIPVAGLHGYNASLYTHSTESTSDITRELHRAESVIDTN